jgi:hypothetical protein
MVMRPERIIEPPPVDQRRQPDQLVPGVDNRLQRAAEQVTGGASGDFGRMAISSIAEISGSGSRSAQDGNPLRAGAREIARFCPGRPRNLVIPDTS